MATLRTRLVLSRPTVPHALISTVLRGSRSTHAVALRVSRTEDAAGSEDLVVAAAASEHPLRVSMPPRAHLIDIVEDVLSAAELDKGAAGSRIVRLARAQPPRSRAAEDAHRPRTPLTVVGHADDAESVEGIRCFARETKGHRTAKAEAEGERAAVWDGQIALHVPSDLTDETDVVFFIASAHALQI